MSMAVGRSRRQGAWQGDGMSQPSKILITHADWIVTMDPERRTLLQVRLEDIAECETIFTTLMGEDV